MTQMINLWTFQLLFRSGENQDEISRLFAKVLWDNTQKSLEFITADSSESRTLNFILLSQYVIVLRDLSTFAVPPHWSRIPIFLVFCGL